LKNRFCDIETNCRDRLHGLAPPNQVTPLAITVRGTYVPVEEPSTASNPDIPLVIPTVCIEPARPREYANALTFRRCTVPGSFFACLCS